MGTFLQSDVQTVRSQSCHLLTERRITNLPAMAADEWRVKCVMSVSGNVFVRRVFVEQQLLSNCSEWKSGAFSVLGLDALLLKS